MVKISCRPDGPYLIEGEIELLDPTGARVDTSARPKIALCRCGHSSLKPMCDGSHARMGFKASEKSIPQPPKS